MARPRVLLVEPMYHGAGEVMLRESCDVTVLTAPNREEIVAAARDAHAICSRYPHQMDEAVFALARELVICASSGRGTDAIDIDAATAHGVAVVNNPGFGPIPVSEQAVGFMLALARQFFRLDRNMRAGQGWKQRGLGDVFDVEGRTIGLVGLGAIGREMARKCRLAFRMEVLCYDPYVSAEQAGALGATMVGTLDELLARSDFVSMHPELNDETRGMIGEAQLKKMKPTAFLINTARGKVVQQAPLVRALRERWIAGAALDVYEDEPLAAGNPLYECETIILSPHIAGLSTDAVKGMSISTATQVIDAVSGRRPAHILNPQCWARAEARQRALGIAPATR